MPILFENFREMLVERLLILGKNEKYNQAVILAGGAGSGKGHVINTLIGPSAGGNWKVYDPDALKVTLIDLAKKLVAMKDKLKMAPSGGGRVAPGLKPLLNILNTKDPSKINIKDVADRLASMDLRNAENVSELHELVKKLGLEQKQFFLTLQANKDSDFKPNIILDRTLQREGAAGEMATMLRNHGYKPENIHIVWVLADYKVALARNYERGRRVPNFILLDTHFGAKKTMTELVFKNYGSLGINGDIAVVMNDGSSFVPQYIRLKKAGESALDETGLNKVLKAVEKLAPTSKEISPELAAKYKETNIAPPRPKA